MIGWLYAGRDALRGIDTEIDPLKADPAEFDALVVGTPVWAGRASPAARMALKAHAGRFKRAAFFCTAGGGDPSKTFVTMEDAAGAAPVATLALRTSDVKGGDADGFAVKVREFAERIAAG